MPPNDTPPITRYAPLLPSAVADTTPPTLNPAARAASVPRVRLDVGTSLLGPLAGALLARGLQPVRGSSATHCDLDIREFRAGAPAPISGRSPAPLLALLVGAPGAGDRPGGEPRAKPEASVRQQALQAGAVSLLPLDGSTADIDAIARVATRLLNHRATQLPAAAPSSADARTVGPAAPAARRSAAVPRQASGAIDRDPADDPRASAHLPPELVAAIDDAVAHAQRRSAVGALMLVALHRLDEIGVALGVGAAKSLLDTTEARIEPLVRRDGQRHPKRPAAEVYRLGAGFAIVWPQLPGGDAAEQHAQALLQRIALPVQVGGEEIFPAGHIGIALLPHDGTTAATLIEAARRALHQAQRLGPGRSQVHHHDAVPQARERLRLETRLRHAITRGGFDLHYQPQVDLHTGALTGAEALLRWPDAEHGTVAPAVFIPVAEATGLIVPLGHWVVQRVCRQIRHWLDRGLEVPRIAINLSPLQVREPDLVPRLLDALASQRLTGRHLAIEITEAALTADDTVLRQRLQALREAGVQVAIDDFGTGRSSLAALRRLPVDGLKIDRSFVTDLKGDGAAICSAIVGLAHTLGLRVVAEGIETEEQLDFLRRLGCDEFQGHVLAPALGATTLGEVLAGASIQHRIPPAPTLPTHQATHPLTLPQRLPPDVTALTSVPTVKPTTPPNASPTLASAPVPRRTGAGRPKSTIAGWPATQLDRASTLSRLF